MSFCHECGGRNPHEAKFCGACGTRLLEATSATQPTATQAAAAQHSDATEPIGAAVPTATPAATPESSQQPTTARVMPPAPASGWQDQPVAMPKISLAQVDLTRVLAGDWLGAAKVALATWLTAIVLTVALLALMHPNGASVKQFLIGVAMVLSSTFGGDIVASISGFDGPGYSMSIGAYPLAITLASLAVGMWLFHRQVRHYRDVRAALWHVLRASLVLTVLVVVPLMALRGRLDVPHFGAVPNVGGLAGNFGGHTAAAGALGFLFFVIALCATLLWRNDWLHPRLLQAKNLLAAPASGLVAMVVTSSVIGLVTAGGIFLLLPSAGRNTTTAAVLLAVLPNLGFGAAMVGGGVGLRADDGGFDLSRGNKTVHLPQFADHVSNWLWLAVVATVAIFAVGALVTIVRSRSRGDAAQNLVVWMLLTTVTLPLFSHFVGLHLHAQGGHEKVAAYLGLVGWQVLLLGAAGAFVVAVIGSAFIRAGHQRSTAHEQTPLTAPGVTLGEPGV